MFTRGKFLELLKSLDPEPNFLVTIINECFSRLPKVVSQKLAQQLYLKYFWEGDKLKLISNLTGEEIYFTSYKEVYTYLSILGYKPSHGRISNAFLKHSKDYCNHEFIKENVNEKEAIYFE